MIGEKLLKKQVETFVTAYCDPYEGEDGEDYILLNDFTDNVHKISQQAKGMRMQTNHIKDAVTKYVDIKLDDEGKNAFVKKEDIIIFLLEELKGSYKKGKRRKKK